MYLFFFQIIFPFRMLHNIEESSFSYPAAMRGTWARSLGWEYSLEKEMATHSSTLALKIPWTEELGAGYYPRGRKESGTTGATSLSFFLS